METIPPVQRTEAFRQVQPVLDRTFGRAYPPRPDTIASMAKTGTKRFLIVTVVLGLLYALYLFIASRFSSRSTPPSSPAHARDERKDPVVQSCLDEITPIKTTFKEGTDVSESTVYIPSEHPPVIYDPLQAKENATILESYKRVAIVSNQSTGFEILSQLLGNLMDNMGSSPEFKELIQIRKDEQAVSQLIDFIHTTYGEFISSYLEMPPLGKDKEQVKAKIVAIMKK